MRYCSECVYFERFTDGKTDLGYCKINAPVIIPQSGNKTGHWPIVGQNTSVCGEGVSRS